MVMQRVVVALRHFLGEIALELAPEIGIVRHRAVEQFVVERELGVGEQHRQLRPRQRQVALAPLGDRHFVGQEFHRAVELPAHFQRLHEPLLEAEVFQPAPLRHRKRQRLLIVVAQHQARDLVGHFGQQRVARFDGQRAGAQRPAQRDLDVDLDVGGVDAGGIVDGVGVEPDAGERRLDAAALGHAEIGALADHLAAQLGAGDADGVVGAVASRLVAFVRRAHIGADAAEEQQIDLRLQDRLHQLLRRHRLAHAEQLLRRGAEPDFLGRARIDAAALRDQ